MNDKSPEARKDETPADALARAAARYGDAALENYARVRSLGEAIASGFCRWLSGCGEQRCAYLVPPKGPWSPADYRSGAFSVSGRRFLPLQPISFGVAVRVSETGDWMRVVLTAAKNGPAFDVYPAGGERFTFTLPVDDDQLGTFFVHLHEHLVDWFAVQSREYEHGAYGGGGEMGFDFLEVEEGEAETAHEHAPAPIDGDPDAATD